MSTDNHPAVLIAGAGPVGQFAALSLARRGVPVRIVDTGVWACRHSYALAIHPQTFPLFRELGVLDDLLDGAYCVDTLALYDQSGPRARLKANTTADPVACLAVVKQERIEQVLEAALAAAGVKIEWRHELVSVSQTASGVQARVDRLEKESRGYIVAHTEWVVSKSYDVEAQYVIGADGYNSRVRRAAGISFPEVAPASYYAVFEFQSNLNLKNEARLLLGPETTDVLWPLPEDYARWSFQLPGYTDPEAEHLKDRLLSAGFGYFPTERNKERITVSAAGALPALEDVHLHALLAERAPWFHADIDHITWRTLMRFERRLASSFGAGRLWLAGDAAHLTAPGGIQSMNLGFFEAAELTAALAGILKGSATQAALEVYNQRWPKVWSQLHGLDVRFQPGPDADPWVAGHAAALLPQLPAHGDALAALYAQAGITLT